MAVLLILQAAQTLAAAPGEAADILKVAQREPENWFQRELRRFLSYPHLDQYYRLIKKKKYPEARRELELYLKRSPEDLNARYTYMVLVFEMKDHPDTVRTADQILQEQPGDDRALLYRGLARTALGERAAAMADLLQAAETGQNLEPAQRHYALSLSAENAIQLKRYEEARQALLKLAGLKDDFEVRLRLATLAETMSRFDEAAREAQTAKNLARTREQRLQALRLAGELARKGKRWGEARKALQEALELAPGDPGLVRSLAYTAYADGKHREAVEWLQQLLVLEPQDGDRVFLGQLLYQQKRPQEAIEQLGRVDLEALAPEQRFQVLATLGYAHQSLKDYRKAAARFEQALALKRDPALTVALAQVREKAGPKDEAIKALQEALRQKPSTDLHLSLAWLLLQEGRDQEAARHLLTAYEALPPGKDRVAVEKNLGYLYQRSGRYGEARRFLERAAAADSQDAELYTALGHIAMRQKDPAGAVSYFEKSLALRRSREVLRELVAAQMARQEWEKALEGNRTLLAMGGMSASERAEILRSQGYLYQKLKRPAQAAAAFRESLAVGGGRAPDTLREDLGYALLASEDPEAALDHFEAAARTDPSPRNLITLGNIQAQRGKTGLAIHYFQAAAERREQLSRTEQAQLFLSLGNLYAEEGQYGDAARAYETAQALDYQPETALHQGAVLRRSGQTEAARKLLEGLDEQQLDGPQRLQRLDELAAVYWSLNASDRSVELLNRALTLEPSATREHLLGSRLRQLGRTDQGIAHLEAAVRLDPKSSAYAEDLAYAYLERKDYEQAVPLLETALLGNPQRLRLHQDLGYAYLHQVENDKAVAAFMRAIDNRPNYPAGSEAEERELDEEIWRLRSEVRKLRDELDFTVYQSYRSHFRQGQGITAGGLSGGVVPSQGGVQLGYQPPVIGFRDERTFQVFGRILWSTLPDTLDIDDRTVQAGVGLRYKPLKEHNLFLSAERLIAIGNQAANDWLLRALYGWSSPMEYPPGGASNWNYSSVYGDLGYFIDNDIWAFYGEARQGWTFRLTDWALVSPHLVIDGRTQTRDIGQTSYLEGGAGVSLRFPFNESRYETPGSSLEVLLQYKGGLVNIGGGFVGTGVLRF